MAVWFGFVDGAWNTGIFWIPNVVPNGAGDTASFVILPGSGSGSADINLGGVSRRVGHVDLVSNEFGRYRLFGGTLVMDNGASNATIDVSETASATARFSEIGALTLDSHTVITVTGTGAVLELKGKISGAGGWTKAGSGAVNLYSGTNDWTGGLNMSAGKVVMKAANALSGGVDFSGNATLDLGGFNQFVSSLTGTATNAKVINNGAVAATLSVGGAATFAFAGDIEDGAGTLSLTFSSNSSPTLILTGDNTYSGSTTIGAGETLQIGDGGSTGAIGRGAIANGGQLIFNRTGATTVEGDISGTGTLTKSGTGTVRLNGANSYTGATVVNNGVLQGGVDEGFSANSSVTVNAGGTLDLGGFSQTIKSLTGSGTVTNSVGGADALAVTTDASITFSGKLTDGAAGVLGLTKLGASIFTLTGANTYSGTTTVSAGTLRIGNNGASGAIGSGAVINAAEVVFARANNFTILSDLAGAGVYRKLGAASTLTLGDDNNTFTGVFELEAGTLKGGVANAFSASGRINMASATTLDLGGFNQTVAGLSGLGLVTNSALAAATLTQSSSQNTVYSGVIADGVGVVNLAKAGTGTLTLGGDNTFSGTTTIGGGVLQVGNGGAGSLGSGNVVLNGGSLVFARSDADSLGGVISGAGSVAKIGAGALLLTGANTYSGVTTISAGTLQVGNGVAGSLGAGAIVNNATLIFDRNDNTAIVNAISGAGTLRKQGTGTATFSGVNTYAGATLIEEGTLKAGAANVTLFSSSMEITAGAKFDLGGFSQSVAGRVTGAGGVDNSGAAAATFTANVALGQSGTIGGVISDTGGDLSLVKNGDGVLGLAGANTYAGTTTINGGTLDVTGAGTANPLGTGAVLNNGLLNFSKTTSFTVGNAISGGGALRKVNAARLTLTGANIYTGQTTIEAGTLRIGNGGATGTAGFGAIVNNAFLEFNRADAFTVSNVISGGGHLTFVGPGVMTMTAANSYTGFTQVDAGTLKAGAANVFASSSELNLFGGAFDLAGFSQSIAGRLQGGGAIDNSGGAATLTIDTPLALSGIFSGVISNSGGALSIVKNGAGVQTLRADSTYSGTTTINGGILEVDNAGVTSGLGAGAVINNATLQFGRTTDFTVANAISGSGEVIKTNAATMTLLGSNSYGVTTINAGVLRVGDGGAQGTLGNLGVTNNASLVFNRSDAITVSNVISGAGTLTQAGAGDLRINGVNTFTGDTIVEAGRLSLDAGGALSTSASIVVRAGAVFDVSSTVEAAIKDLNNAGAVELGGKSLLMTAQISDIEGVINGSAGVDRLKMQMDAADTVMRLDAASFTNWTDGVDEISVKGNALDDTIFGSAQADSLAGLDGADRLRGGLGADILSGGEGDDQFDYLNAADLVAGESIQGDGGVLDTILLGGSQTYSLFLAAVTGVEHLRFFGAGEGAILDGGQIGAGTISTVDADTSDGNSLLVRGGAIDLTDVAFKGWTEGPDTITLEGLAAAASNITGSFFKDTITGGSQADVLNGADGDDIITGNGGADTIDGGAGADTMTGGAGSDSYFVDHASDVIVEAAGGGTTDTVNTVLSSYTLGAEVERLAFTGVGDFTGRGNTLANRLTGGAGNDKFFAESGDADNYLGGDGLDEVSYRALGGATIDFVTGVQGGSATGDSFGSIEMFSGSNTAADTMIAGSLGRRFFGNGGDDTLIGNGGNDILNGGAGNDTLDGGAFADNLTGGAGADTMSGGGGRDNFIYNEAAFGADVVTDFEDGVDRLWFDSAVAQKFSDFTIGGNGSTSVTVTLGAETLTLNGASAITLTATDFVFF